MTIRNGVDVDEGRPCDAYRYRPTKAELERWYREAIEAGATPSEAGEAVRVRAAG